MNIQAKNEMSSKELMILQSELEKRKKSKGIAFLLWFFTGGVGGHRYYIGDIGYAVAMTFTLGGLGIWTLIDAFLISPRIDQKTEELEREIIVHMNLGRGE